MLFSSPARILTIVVLNSSSFSLLISILISSLAVTSCSFFWDEFLHLCIYSWSLSFVLGKPVPSPTFTRAEDLQHPRINIPALSVYVGGVLAFCKRDLLLLWLSMTLALLKNALSECRGWGVDWFDCLKTPLCVYCCSLKIIGAIGGVKNCVGTVSYIDRGICILCCSDSPHRRVYILPFVSQASVRSLSSPCICTVCPPSGGAVLLCFISDAWLRFITPNFRDQCNTDPCYPLGEGLSALWLVAVFLRKAVA